MTKLLTTIQRFAPLMFFHREERFFPCSIEFLLKNSILRSNKQPKFGILNPTQQDLATYHAEDYYLEVNPTQYHGMMVKNQIKAPVYVAIQQFEEYLEINYIFLYAFQSGQTCQGMINRDFNTPEVFNCTIHTYGEHQGELERILVRLVPDPELEYKIIAVGYEAHGKMRCYESKYVPFSGEHPIVYVALNGHSCRNRVMERSPLIERSYRINSGGVAIVSIFEPHGLVWPTYATSDFCIIGLCQGEPINDQVWAKFAGRLGARYRNKLSKVTYLNGTNLSLRHKRFVDIVKSIAQPFIPTQFDYSIGPIGPGGRDYITQR